MSTPFEAAQLNLQLFDMRREPELRRARHWFVVEFHPETADEFFATMMSDKNAWIRMVMGYWDMAASLVTTGAIDVQSFIAAHGEILGAYSKVEPFLADLRTRISPRTLAHVEQLVAMIPDGAEELAKRRARLKRMYDAMQAAKATA
jgi:hypothetical protein